MHCTNNAKNNEKMDGVEVSDLCSVTQTKNEVYGKGKESAKQEIKDKMKSDITDRMEDEIRTKKSKSLTNNKEVETTMMCWEAVNDLLEKEPRKEHEKEENKSIKKTVESKHEEEHVKSTLNIGK